MEHDACQAALRPYCVQSQFLLPNRNENGDELRFVLILTHSRHA